MTGIEIASAYVTLTTKMPGVKNEIETAVGGVDSAGAGEKIGTGIAGGISGKQAAIAGAVGGIFASLTGMAANALSDLVGQAVQASDATDKFKQTLGFAGLDTSAIDVATAKSRDYADRTVYDLGTIQNTTAQLAANGIKDYSGLTEAAGNLNAVAGGNQETFKSVAMMLTQTAGAGKLTTENWNQLADAIPGASGQLQNALLKAGAYTGNFRDAMAQGQITSDEFNNALMKLGTQPVAVEAASSVKTMEGATGNLAASITGRLADAFTAIKPFLTGFMSAIAGFVSNSDIFIPVISGLAVALLVALAPAIWAAVVATAAWTVALLANPITWIILAIVALVAGIVALAMHWDQVVKFVTQVWGGFITWITGVINGFAGWWNGIWSGFGNWIKSVWEGFIGWIQNKFMLFKLGLQIIGTAISTWWTGLWTGIGNWVKSIWDGIVSKVKWFFGSLKLGLQLIGDSIKTWWNNLWTGIKNFVGGIWSGIIGAVRTAISTVKNTISNILGGIRGTWERIWQGMVNFLGNVFGGIVGIARGPINGIIGLINGAIRAINGVHVTIPGWVPVIGGQSWGLSIPTIPQLAQGGIIRAQSGGVLANIGEGRYDEAVVPLSPTVLAQLGGGRGGDEIHIEGVPIDEALRTVEKRKRRRMYASGSVAAAGVI